MWNMNRPRTLTPNWLTTSFSLLILAGPVAPARAATVVSETIWGTAGSDGSAAVALAADGSGYVAGAALGVASADGSVYVAGVAPRFAPDGAFLGSDVVLLKVAANGRLAWQRTVTAGESADARGGVTVAPDGSVYVAGGRFDPRTSDLNALLLK